MAGSSTAPEESVRARLEAEFGPKRAAEILGDTTPPARRRQVPDHVGRRPKRTPSWSDKDAGSPKGVDWKNAKDGADERPSRINLLTARGKMVVRCHTCQTVVERGNEFLRFSYRGNQRDYCPPCGAAEARKHPPMLDEGAVAPRVLVASTAVVACLAAVVLCALAIATAGIERSERFLWGAVLAVVVAVALGIFGAVTWGNTPDE